jgi:hypothetical protein
MKLRGRTTWAGLVWLTVGLTLLAATPHWHCLCPDGHLKPFCLASLQAVSFSPRACCQAPERGCCCRAHRPAELPPDDSPCQAQGAGCQKTLAEVGLAVPTGSSPWDEVALAVPVTALSCLPLALPAGESRSVVSTSGRSPPVDLVVVLQHFLI